MTATDLTYTAANNSPMLAVDPTEPRFVVAAHRIDAPMFSCGLQLSGDRGRGWIGADPVPHLPPGAERCYAPEVAFDRQGKLFYLFVGLQGAGNAPMGVFLTTSTDRGRTWHAPWQVLGEENYMVRLGIDRTVGDHGRIYLVWLHAAVAPPLGGLPPSTNPILAAHSDDGGRSFSAPVQVSDPSRPRAVAPALVVGTDQAVHVAYYDLGGDSRDYQGLEGPVWEGPWSVVMATSVDRGATFRAGVVAVDGVVPPGRVMLIYTMAPPGAAAGPGGRVYVVWPDAREGSPDVFLTQSSDGGANWQAPRRLNDDTGAPAASVQQLPRVDVAPDGRVDVAFLDRRNDPENLKGDAYFTSSSDNGASFGPNIRLTTESSDSRIGQRYQVPSAQGLVEIGSRLGLVSQNGDALVAWPDMRNASIGTNEQDVFATVVRTNDALAAPPKPAGASDAPVLVGGGAALGGIAVLVFLGARSARRRRVA